MKPKIYIAESDDRFAVLAEMALRDDYQVTVVPTIGWLRAHCSVEVPAVMVIDAHLCGAESAVMNLCVPDVPIIFTVQTKDMWHRALKSGSWYTMFGLMRLTSDRFLTQELRKWAKSFVKVSQRASAEGLRRW